jgi:hypothetical protein
LDGVCFVYLLLCIRHSLMNFVLLMCLVQKY